MFPMILQVFVVALMLPSLWYQLEALSRQETGQDGAVVRNRTAFRDMNSDNLNPRKKSPTVVRGKCVSESLSMFSTARRTAFAFLDGVNRFFTGEARLDRKTAAAHVLLLLHFCDAR